VSVRLNIGAGALNENLHRTTQVEYAQSLSRLPISPVDAAIIKTLLYFDIFKYPLTEDEIVRFSTLRHTDSIAEYLRKLYRNGLINKKDKFFYLGQNEFKVFQRLQRNANAQKYIPLAKKYSKWMSYIPFVHCVCISGSLSKNDMGDNADIDYFVIAKKNRVWIMRFIFSLLIKPLTMMGLRHRYLCPNYIIDNYHLEIRDKNMYTAIEVATLIPTIGAEGYDDFMKANSWIYGYLPNYIQSDIAFAQSKKRNNWIWDNVLFTYLDNIIFALYKRYYRKKFYDSKHWEIEDFELKFSKFESKNHLNGYRNKILTKLEDGIARYERNFGIKLGRD
jgi:hypothetical protein